MLWRQPVLQSDTVPIPEPEPKDVAETCRNTAAEPNPMTANTLIEISQRLYNNAFFGPIPSTMADLRLVIHTPITQSNAIQLLQFPVIYELLNGCAADLLRYQTSVISDCSFFIRDIYCLLDRDIATDCYAVVFTFRQVDDHRFHTRIQIPINRLRGQTFPVPPELFTPYTFIKAFMIVYQQLIKEQINANRDHNGNNRPRR